MREIVTTLVVSGAAFMLWRAYRSHHDSHQFQALPAHPAGDNLLQNRHYFTWPSLGKFDFAVANADAHQAALRRAIEQLPAKPSPSGALLCQAELHAGPGEKPRHIYHPVEVWIHGERVAQLSVGDASRFQRRLAFEGRVGEVSVCDAIIVASAQGGRTVFEVRLDLKEFRH
ncbi:hypothetical protein [Variovorax sp. HJSM1_2]|uniref:hypothetical protein n=1 Tax=Variovorax sp. HJSM1_2 TaxID=3366263 RepID=UPI003BE850C1